MTGKSDSRLKKVIGNKPFGTRGNPPTNKSQRQKLGEIPGLHAENLHNPKVGQGSGGHGDAADLAQQKARADARKARDSSHDDS